MGNTEQIELLASMFVVALVITFNSLHTQTHNEVNSLLKAATLQCVRGQNIYDLSTTETNN